VAAVSAAEALLVLAAGLGAGTINAVIGSGTLITFPVLLAVGYPPVVANVSNNVGLVPGSIAAVHGWRRELRGRWRHAIGLAAGSAVGALIGSTLLLALPESSFEVVVPVLIGGALVLVALQPRISAAVEARRRPDRPRGGRFLRAGIFATGVYGGYFGAAQGILLFALLGTAVPDDLQHANALRNLLAGTANGVAAIVFLTVADVAYLAVLLLAAGAAVGGVLGARVGRRLSPKALRIVVIVVGCTAIVRLVL
jgi:uncharacterized membrane protein YfcA